MPKSIRTNAILNVLKQVSVIIFPLITFPYLARVLGAANYGKVTFAISIANYASLTALLGIPSYAIREGARHRENKKRVGDLANELFSINLIATFLVYVILGALLLFVPALSQYRILILLLVTPLFFNAIGADWVNNVYEDFFYLTIRYLIFQTLFVVGVFILVQRPGDYYQYAALYAMPLILAGLSNVFYIRKYIKLRFTKQVRLKRHIGSVMIFFANNLATTIYINSGITMLGLLKGDTLTGVYAIASNIYVVIVSVINAITMVTIPRLSLLLREKNEKEYQDIVSEVLHVVLILVVPSVVGLLFFDTTVLQIIGGPAYLSGAHASRILSVTLLFAVVANVLVSGVLIPNRKEKYGLIATLAAAACNLGLNFIFIPLWGIVGASITTLLSEMLVVGITLYYSKNLVHFKGIKNNILTVALSSLGVVFVCALCKWMIHNMILQLGAAVIGSAVLYLILLYLLRNQTVMRTVKQILYRQ